MNLTDVFKTGRHEKGKRKGHGAGSGMGKQSGRGNKGRGQHAGKGQNPLYEGGQMPYFRRLPKRGFSQGVCRKTYAVINVGARAEFAAGARVGPEELAGAGLVQDLLDGVKVLGGGEPAKGLAVRAHRFSQSAKAKIEAAGGTVEIVSTPAYRIRRQIAKAPAGPQAAAAPKAAGSDTAKAGGP
jgi:large subunit ribosomal protein L15